MSIGIRRATAADLPTLVAMLADDHLGAAREAIDNLTPYQQALAAMNADSNQYQAVAVLGDEVVGMMQLVLIPGLSHKGSTRLLIEAVRVRADLRGGGIGGQMITWAIDYARQHDCRLVELTTHKSRQAAHRFYERLGFEQSHCGYKLLLR